MDPQGSSPNAPLDSAARMLLLTAPEPPSGEAILMVDALRRLGAHAVERESDGVGALFAPHDDPVLLAAEAELAIRASTSLRAPIVRWRWLQPEEWLARRGVESAVVRVGKSEIRLEPSTAFGTAEHATTRACLRLLEAMVEEGDHVLDVGAGSGILAIAALALGAGAAVALESDPLAVAAARRNARLNGVDDRIRTVRMEAVPGRIRVAAGGAAGGEGREREPGYDGIVANIGADVLRPLMGDLAAALAPDGWLVLSGILPSERTGLVEAARRAGLVVVEEVQEDGWWTGRLAVTREP